MYQFYFEKLEVWQGARRFTKELYIITANFPDLERFGLTSQLRRASSSIAANIAEGVHRSSNKDKARFVNQAYSSAMEVINFLILAYDLTYITEIQYINLREQVELITSQLNALHKTLT